MSAGRTIGLAHGAGGRAMRELIETLFVAAADDMEIDGTGVAAMDDGAAIFVEDRWLVMTTDTHVVQPLFFPGGDIGRLAVSGTVNDLAAMGATEVLGLSCAFVIEEGFPRADLERIHASMRAACIEAHAPIITGDTRVMGHRQLDGLIVNTTGIAFASRVVTDAGLAPGDRLIVTGTVGDHGLTVLATRCGIAGLDGLRSDVAPIGSLVRAALEAGGEDVVAMKDPTRGGVASALGEMARKAGVGIQLDATAVPVSSPARAAAELLGIDPMHLSSQGRMVLGVRPMSADRVLAALRAHPRGAGATLLGAATAGHVGQVVVEDGFERRVLGELDGDPVAREC